MAFTPTDEQVAAVDLSETRTHMAVEALAGTGKTSTLELIARANRRSGLYLAFNKAIVEEASTRFPGHVRCSTAHSMAFRPVGVRYKHRLRGKRMKSNEIARMLDIEPVTIQTKFGSKRLAPGFLAGVVMRGVRRFCQTADLEPEAGHIPSPNTMQDEPGLRAAWGEVQIELEPALVSAWEDIEDPAGRLPFEHNCYLKMWQLSEPKIEADYILFDEAQDANPVMLSIVEAQRDHAQLIFVGDRNQQIYGWNGAVNAMEKAPVDERTYLTHSFRFGPEIAAQANAILAMLGDTRIVGRGGPGYVGPVDRPDIVLTRTNAVAVRGALEELDAGGRPHVVGGADDVVMFAQGAKSLKDEGWTSHHDLACFQSWAEVLEYVDQDELGSDLGLLVELVDEFTPERIIGAFNRQPAQKDATRILSTAHKSKGREWDAVKLADDFPEDDDKLGVEEVRLLYVGATRAMRRLDVEQVGVLREHEPPADDDGLESLSMN